MSDDVLRDKTKAAKYWDSRSAKVSPGAAIAWWQSPAVVRHLNKKLCGQELDGFAAGLRKWYESESNSQVLERGVSVGCGTGGKELQFLKEGLVKHFDLYEISEVRVAQGHKIFEQAKLHDQVNFFLEDAFIDRTPNRYDLVHWDNSLHHMFDVYDAIEWSKTVLKPGGWLIIHDFIGASRFQFSERCYDFARRAREALPHKYLESGYSPGTFLPTSLPKVNKDVLIAKDPTEAADSERIVDAVSKHFPNGTWKMLGGAVYHLGLTGLHWNFIRFEDHSRLDACLFMDDMASDLGENLYGAFVGRLSG